MICAISSHHFDGADKYPFKNCKKVMENPFDLIEYMNN